MNNIQKHFFSRHVILLIFCILLATAAKQSFANTLLAEGQQSIEAINQDKAIELGAIQAITHANRPNTFLIDLILNNMINALEAKLVNPPMPCSVECNALNKQREDQAKNISQTIQNLSTALRQASKTNHLDRLTRVIIERGFAAANNTYLHEHLIHLFVTPAILSVGDLISQNITAISSANKSNIEEYATHPDANVQDGFAIALTNYLKALKQSNQLELVSKIQKEIIHSLLGAYIAPRPGAADPSKKEEKVFNLGLEVLFLSDLSVPKGSETITLLVKYLEKDPKFIALKTLQWLAHHRQIGRWTQQSEGEIQKLIAKTVMKELIYSFNPETVINEIPNLDINKRDNGAYDLIIHSHLSQALELALAIAQQTDSTEAQQLRILETFIALTERNTGRASVLEALENFSKITTSERARLITQAYLNLEKSLGTRSISIENASQDENGNLVASIVAFGERSHYWLPKGENKAFQLSELGSSSSNNEYSISFVSNRKTVESPTRLGFKKEGNKGVFSVTCKSKEHCFPIQLTKQQVTQLKMEMILGDIQFIPTPKSPQIIYLVQFPGKEEYILIDALAGNSTPTTYNAYYIKDGVEVKLEIAPSAEPRSMSSGPSFRFSDASNHPETASARIMFGAPWNGDNSATFIDKQKVKTELIQHDVGNSELLQKLKINLSRYETPVYRTPCELLMKQP